MDSIKGELIFITIFGGFFSFAGGVISDATLSRIVPEEYAHCEKVCEPNEGIMYILMEIVSAIMVENLIGR